MLGIVAASAWGLQRLMESVPIHVAALAIVSALTIFLAFVFSVILAFGGAFLGAPAIAADVENGTALAILPRPLSRTEYVVGKWLGLAALLTIYATVFGALEVGAIALTTGYRPPDPLAALAFLIAQSLTMLSLALALSTRLAPVTGGLIAVLCFGVAWIAGIAKAIAAALHNDTVLHAATLIGLLVPSDGLWRGALFHLEPVVILAAANAATFAPPNPFSASAPPPTLFVAWSIAWIAVAVGVAAFSFARRDL